MRMGYNQFRIGIYIEEMEMVFNNTHIWQSLVVYHLSLPSFLSEKIERVSSFSFGLHISGQKDFQQH